MSFLKFWASDDKPATPTSPLSKVPGGSVSPPSVPKEKEQPVEEGKPNILLSLVSNLSVGTDVFKSGLSLPVELHEPMTVVQRSAELLDCVNILERAVEAKDEKTRLAMVTAYAVSGFLPSERTYTDFPSILGETFEYVEEERGIQFLGECVSVDPPICASHTEHKAFSIWQNSTVNTQFLGNSVDLDTKGRTHVHFKDCGEHYLYTNPRIRIHSLLFGSIWIEHYGELTVSNLSNGDKCVITFKKSGFFEGTRYDIDGYVVDKTGKKHIYLHGFWNKSLSAKWLVDTKTHSAGHTEELWRAAENVFTGGKYGFTRFAEKLLDVNENSTLQVLPTTDARLRADRWALGVGDVELATKYRKQIVETQNKQIAAMEKEKKDFVPTHFSKIPEENGDGYFYVYCGDYWEQREDKVNKLKKGEKVDGMLEPTNVSGKACDFKTIPTY